MTNIYETGSTVTLRASFTDIVTGQLTNTDTIPTVTIYDKNLSIVGTFEASVEGVGKYKLVYNIPSGTAESTYFYEFKGTLTGVIALNRGKFYTRFSA